MSGSLRSSLIMMVADPLLHMAKHAHTKDTGMVLFFNSNHSIHHILFASPLCVIVSM